MVSICHLLTWSRRRGRGLWLLLFVVGLLAGGGCQTATPLVSRVLVRNETATTVKNVRVQHFPTRVMASTSAILPGRELTLRFSPQTVKAVSAVVNWEERGVAREAALRIPARVPDDPDQDYRLVYTLLPQGRADVFFRKEK
jgi:hypothetical protein